ncbi:hypothetical protein HNQ07_000213 [Deinococcus metalli]|uniref:Uncharacterized protein n=1 Tax=Deinococcus metalli TaxID=1141878 RepID=A0A7W8KAP2_9DEIO|nr:hypothetical protein [Deinococcus metalli]MBB5374769.1 hypothetical protein [Deinococcus metalli]GHF33850.1 hypothetical protein GCM10017781_08290 [Deinococcus metalli]
MSETPLSPLLVLHAPPGHDVDPQALDALKAYAGARYGASVLVNPRLEPARAHQPLLLGDWGAMRPGRVLADLQPLIARVFFNLDWLADVI